MLAQELIRHQLDTLPRDYRGGFLRLCAPLETGSFLEWISAQALYPRIYWRARSSDGPEYLALGSIHELASAEEIRRVCTRVRSHPDEGPRYYGGLAFDPCQAGWEGFGPCRFILPRLELVRRGGHTTLCLNLWLPERHQDAERQAAAAALMDLREPQPLPPLSRQQWWRHDSPGPDQWRSLVETVTAPHFQAHTPKVVLSRESRLTMSEPVSPWQMLARWADSAPDCFHFGFQFVPEQAFIACSPERLYRREGRHLFTEALAGTIRRSGDEAADAALADELLADGKNRLENRFVHADILDRLAPLAASTSLGEPRILKLRLLQHLKRDIEAELRPGVCDWQLLNALHPTPAVGGAPREAALDFIRRHEPHKRGWYAGACGMLSGASAEFAVAIRSAHVTPQTVSLYAGAGIVAGSEPSAEWAELDHKIANVLSLLA